MIIGDRIAERLRHLGLSQAELARRVGLDQSTINGLVRGTARSSRHLHRIARELKTTAGYLEGETDDSAALFPDEEFTSEEREWVALLRALEPGDRKAALTLIRTIATSARIATINEPGRDYRGEAEDG